MYTQMLHVAGIFFTCVPCFAQINPYMKLRIFFWKMMFFFNQPFTAEPTLVFQIPCEDRCLDPQTPPEVRPKKGAQTPLLTRYSEEIWKTAFHQETRQPLPLSQEGKSFESVFCTSFTPWYGTMLLKLLDGFLGSFLSPVGHDIPVRSRVLKERL